MPAQTTLKGNALDLAGTELKVGDKFPDVELSKSLVDKVKTSEFTGKKVIVSVVPSLDTGICDLQAKRFYEEVKKNENLTVLIVSRDLPPAMARWCGAADATDDRLVLLSDYNMRTFGKATGTDIPALGVLCRAVFVVGEDGTIKHADYVSEVTDHPDYDAAMAAVN